MGVLLLEKSAARVCDADDRCWHSQIMFGEGNRYAEEQDR